MKVLRSILIVAIFILCGILTSIAGSIFCEIFDADVVVVVSLFLFACCFIKLCNMANDNEK